ncbi:phosphatase PAP2 family protein [Amycolatopsis anabasis]|uniref:phosphatase PAP2 family protein n=1 Tax=Amycolatopsis anabasis TaxID=1840409 RepID=UPI00131BE81F|nr:phosphatase PAP2 family protein [Amycolatopsis anabasis]
MNAASLRWAAAGVALTAAFVVLGLLVRSHPLGVDLTIAESLRGQWRHPPGDIAAVVSDVLGPVLPIVFGVALLVAAGLSFYRGDRTGAGVFLRVALVLALCRATSIAFKPVFLRDRPREYPDLAYPSGHVVSVASTGFAAVLLCAYLAARLVRRAIAIAAVAVVLCAASRLVLGVHWLTDTVGAVLAVAGVGLLTAVLTRLLPTGVGDRRGGVASHS